MSVDTANLKDAIKAIESRYGKGTIRRSSEAQSILRIPTGSLELDHATGGGIPIGRTSRIWGSESTGKTTLSLNIAKNAHELPQIAEQYLDSDYDPIKRIGQEMLDRFPNGLEVAYYNIEKSEDKEYIEVLGVDGERLYVIDNVTTVEGAGEIIEGLLSSIHVHIIDSCTAAIALDELNSDMSDWHVGLGARTWGKVLRKINERMDNNRNVIIQIDQARIDLRTGAENPPGGKAMGHNSSMTIHMKRGSWLFRKNGELQKQGNTSTKTLSGGLEADGREINVRVTKSKVGTPLKEARLNLDFSTSRFDELEQYVKAAIYYGEVKQSGAWFELPNGEKVHGRGKVKEAIASDPDLKLKIFESVYKNILEKKVR